MSPITLSTTYQVEGILLLAVRYFRHLGCPLPVYPAGGVLTMDFAAFCETATSPNAVTVLVAFQVTAVPLAGFEPATYRVETGRSNPLSYRGK